MALGGIGYRLFNAALGASLGQHPILGTGGSGIAIGPSVPNAIAADIFGGATASGAGNLAVCYGSTPDMLFIYRFTAL